MSHESELLRRRVASERKSCDIALLTELRSLKFRVESAISALHAGRQIDSHMIHNSSMITADIARWNLLIELMPYVEGLS